MHACTVSCLFIRLVARCLTISQPMRLSRAGRGKTFDTCERSSTSIVAEFGHTCNASQHHSALALSETLDGRLEVCHVSGILSDMLESDPALLIYGEASVRLPSGSEACQ